MRWRHTWRISVVRLALLYSCPAKLFSSFILMCQTLWECVRVRPEKPAWVETPWVESSFRPSLYRWFVPAWTRLSSSKTEERVEKNWENIQDGYGRNTKGQDADHHADSDVHDGQSRRIGKTVKLKQQLDYLLCYVCYLFIMFLRILIHICLVLLAATGSLQSEYYSHSKLLKSNISLWW